MAATTLEILAYNTPDVFKNTFNLANGYRLISVARDESNKYMVVLRFKVGDYDTKVAFVTTEHENVSFEKTPAKVYCSCKAYFFYCMPGNRKVKADISPPALRDYKKKTDRPMFNPENLPCMCKHLYALTQAMLREGALKESLQEAIKRIYIPIV